MPIPVNLMPVLDGVDLKVLACAQADDPCNIAGSVLMQKSASKLVDLGLLEPFSMRDGPYKVRRTELGFEVFKAWYSAELYASYDDAPGSWFWRSLQARLLNQTYKQGLKHHERYFPCSHPV